MAEHKTFTQLWRAVARDRALLPNTIDSYWSWTQMFARFVGRGARSWGGLDWERFERHLIGERYSYSARRQARNALNFSFRWVLKIDVGELDLPIIPKPEPALVVVPTRAELHALFSKLSGLDRLACRIMHGSGTRVEETARIRVQDVDLERAMLRVWDGKGEKNRPTVLPLNLIEALRRQIEARRLLHERDLEEGNGWVELPDRLGRKFRGANRELGWQWLLASEKVDERGQRWYRSPDSYGAALKGARREAGMIKRVTCHSLRKAFATEAQQAGMDIRTIQALLGHADLNTTATHYLAVDFRGAFSPADVPTAALRVLPAFERREALALCA